MFKNLSHSRAKSQPVSGGRNVKKSCLRRKEPGMGKEITIDMFDGLETVPSVVSPAFCPMSQVRNQCKCGWTNYCSVQCSTSYEKGNI